MEGLPLAGAQFHDAAVQHLSWGHFDDAPTLRQG
jgi:hypothetical protein